jgi:hypothetical protein
MPDYGTISPGLYSGAKMSSRANLSTMFETEFNQTAFRFTAFAGGEGYGSPRADVRERLAN